jgi:hypothetical protein
VAATWPITAADLRSALGYTEAQGDSSELGLFAAAACERVEDLIGPWDGRVLTRTFRGPLASLRLPWPVASVTGITLDGVSLDLSATGNYQVITDLDAGIIRGHFGQGVLVVSCLARSGPPTIVHLAGREVAKLWWQQSKNGPRGLPAAAADQLGPPMGADLPRKVEGWLSPYRMAGIA